MICQVSDDACSCDVSSSTDWTVAGKDGEADTGV